MAHGITARDKQQGRSMGWHNLTDVRTDLTIDRNWLLEWDIVSKELLIEGIKIPFMALVGSDDGKIIGKPYGPGYHPISNKTFINTVRKAISGIPGAQIESVGSVCDRSKVFVTVSIKGMEKFKIGDREFLDYLNFGNSHDQSTTHWTNFSNTCTVCNNTYTANFEGKHKIKLKVRHSKNAETELENVADIVDSYVGSQALWRAKFERLMNTPMNEDNARNFYAGFVVRNSNEDGSVRELGPKSFKKVERLTELFVSGRGNNGDDRADCFQGGTEFFSHFNTRGNGKNVARQVYSSDFGLGSVAKQRLWGYLNDDDSVKSLINTGRTVIKDYLQTSK